MKRSSAITFVLVTSVLLAVCVSGINARRSQDGNAGYLRYNNGSAKYDSTYIAIEQHNEIIEPNRGRVLGKSGKGAKGSYIHSSPAQPSSSECIKWETYQVTEMEPRYYYWRPSSSKSSKSAESKTQYETQPKYYYVGKSGKGSKGRKLHDKIMMKYVTVEKEVKECVEYKAQENAFTVSGGKSGKAGGKSGKSQSIVMDEIIPIDESDEINSNIPPITTATTIENSTPSSVEEASPAPSITQQNDAIPTLPPAVSAPPVALSNPPQATGVATPSPQGIGLQTQPTLPPFSTSAPSLPTLSTPSTTLLAPVIPSGPPISVTPQPSSLTGSTAAPVSSSFPPQSGSNPPFQASSSPSIAGTSSGTLPTIAVPTTSLPPQSASSPPFQASSSPSIAGTSSGTLPTIAVPTSLPPQSASGPPFQASLSPSIAGTSSGTTPTIVDSNPPFQSSLSPSISGSSAGTMPTITVPTTIPPVLSTSSPQVEIKPTISPSYAPSYLPSKAPVSGSGLTTLQPGTSLPPVLSSSPPQSDGSGLDGSEPTATSSLPPTAAFDSASSVPSSVNVNTLSWDFEDGIFPQTWTTTGDGVWVIDQAQTADDSSYSIRSPDFFTGYTSGKLQANTTFSLDDGFTGGVLKLKAYASVQPPRDIFVLYIDDEATTQLVDTGEFTDVVFGLSPGAHTITFTYDYNPFELPVLPDSPPERLGATWIDSVIVETMSTRLFDPTYGHSTLAPVTSSVDSFLRTMDSYLADHESKKKHYRIFPNN